MDILLIRGSLIGLQQQFQSKIKEIDFLINNIDEDEEEKQLNKVTTVLYSNTNTLNLYPRASVSEFRGVYNKFDDAIADAVNKLEGVLNWYKQKIGPIGDLVIETVDRETDDGVAFVRIIDMSNGYEYECYIIQETAPQ